MGRIHERLHTEDNRNELDERIRLLLSRFAYLYRYTVTKRSLHGLIATKR